MTVLEKALQAGGIDMARATFIDPGFLVMLFHYAFRHPEGFQVVAPNDATAREIFSTHHDWIKKKRIYNTTFPLRTVRNSADLAQQIGGWRSAIVARGDLTEEAARQVSWNFSEVLTNSFTHGKTRLSCIIAGQSFPSKGHTTLVAADFGLSIPGTLQSCKRYQPQSSDADWIALSLQKGVTCGTSRTNLGLGLPDLLDNVARQGGRLLILSRRGIVCADGKSPPELTNLPGKYQPFDGTIILIDLPTSGT